MSTGQHSIHRLIFRLAVPNIVSNISVPLISSVDTALMGHLSELHLGAVGLGAMIFNFLYWNFGFLRMGTTGLTAQAFGRSSDTEIIHTMLRGLILGLGISLVLIIVQRPFANWGALLMEAGPEMSPLVKEYFLIRVWAAPATLSLYVIMGWFFGMQNAIFPLILTIIINTTNILLSFYFVRTLEWGIAGVAWGTVIAQYIGLLSALVLFYARFGSKVKAIQIALLREVSAFVEFLKINGDIFIRTVFLTFAFGFFYRQSSVFGPDLLAVNVVLLQYVNWMSYGIDGFAYAAESLVGRFKGARDDTMLSKAVNWNMIWAMVMAAVIATIYLVFGDQLFGIFTNEKDLVDLASSFLFWMALFPLCGTPSYIWDGIYIGLTASKAMRNSMAVAFVIFILVYYVSRSALGNHSLWLALLTFLVARGLFQWILYKRYGASLQ